MDFTSAALFYGVLLISLVVHEAAHAVTALWGGDRTAYLGGQVTLNPIPHIRREPFGTVLLPIGLLFISNGTWCMGFAHAPIDPVWAYHHPRKAALVSLAGPVSNFILAGIAGVVLKVLVVQELVKVYSASSYLRVFLPSDGATEGSMYAVCMILSAFLVLNLLLGVLNLIPFPPLDGAGVLGGFFHRTLGRIYDSIRTQPMFLLVGMIGIFYFIQDAIPPVFNFAVGLIAG